MGGPLGKARGLLLKILEKSIVKIFLSGVLGLGLFDLLTILKTKKWLSKNLDPIGFR